ncbi:MAG TPA: phosphomannomutase [Methanobacterium sp.]|jgi:phosphomannomutase|nr:MAG: phosphomannomutase [Methanobacterium sp.]HOI71979.1 phosphomannomutase [Methanobacterium sp.]HPX77295.1 phosphomannomutase [Methanobacterium sp.]
MAKYVQNIRGVVNEEITNEFASQLGNIVGNFVGPSKHVVVGRDINVTSQMIKRSITTGLMAAGANVIDFGIAPIPVIHYNMDYYDASAMINISKSNLRPENVDIKIFSDHEIPLQAHPKCVNWDEIGNLQYVYEYRDFYEKAILKQIDTNNIKDKGFFLVLDYKGDAAKPFISRILNKLGCETVLIGSVEGTSAGGFSESTPKSMSLVSELTTSIGADMGIILDNDADNVVFVDHQGNMIREQTVLGIFAKYILQENSGGNIVSSVVASQSLEEIVSENSGQLIKTSVDNVLYEIVSNNAVFGGDEPGLYAFPEFQICFDGIYAVMKMLEILAKENSTLSALAEDIKEYNRTGFTIKCEHEKKDEVIETFMTKFEYKNNINTVDGVRINLDDSFILIRPSRFEPLVRIYIESKSAHKLQELTESTKKIIENVKE